MALLEGEIALVTGAGRGFGEAIARRFAEEGAAVAITSRNPKEIEAVAKAIEQAGGRAIAVPGDVTVAADVDRVVSEVEQKLGPISLFVNNAGVPGPFGPIWLARYRGMVALAGRSISCAPMLFMRAHLARHGRAVTRAGSSSSRRSPVGSWRPTFRLIAPGRSRRTGSSPAGGGSRSREQRGQDLRDRSRLRLHRSWPRRP